MKHWSFIFTEPTAVYEMVRVAAPDKTVARLTLRNEAGVEDAGPPAVICNFLGQVDRGIAGLTKFRLRG